MSDKQNNQPDFATDLVYALIKERRSERRWKNIRFFIGLTIIALITISLFSTSSSFVSLGPSNEKEYVSFIRLDGMIEAGHDFSAEKVLPLLKEAFSDSQAKGVVLDINSGGGTPVQAAIIHYAILDYKNKYHKKVIVVGEDMLASGAYYVAVAADKIYINPNSLTGSIGVIMKGFGFPDLIKKMGVERRVYTSGVNKDRLDPFLPQATDDISKIQNVISEVHNNFNQVVLQGRQGRLHAYPKDIFTGDFWSGKTALKLGLVDGLGNLTDVLRNEFHVSRYRDYSSTEGLMKTFLNQVGTTLDLALNGSDAKMLAKM